MTVTSHQTTRSMLEKNISPMFGVNKHEKIVQILFLIDFIQMYLTGSGHVAAGAAQCSLLRCVRAERGGETLGMLRL